MKHAPLWIALAGSLVSACGGSSSVSVPTFHDYEAQIDKLICDARFRCCTAAQAMARDPMEPDAASCATALDGEIDTTFASIEAGIGSGQLAYDADAGANCIDAATADEADCTATLATLAQPSECAQVLVGTLAANASCDGTTPACAPGLYCSANLAASGTCMATVASGASCATAPCSTGLTCLSASTTCGAPLADGAACTSPLDCASEFCDNSGSAATNQCQTQTVAQAVCS